MAKGKTCDCLEDLARFPSFYAAAGRVAESPQGFSRYVERSGKIEATFSAWPQFLCIAFDEEAGRLEYAENMTREAAEKHVAKIFGLWAQEVLALGDPLL